MNKPFPRRCSENSAPRLWAGTEPISETKGANGQGGEEEGGRHRKGGREWETRKGGPGGQRFGKRE